MYDYLTVAPTSSMGFLPVLVILIFSVIAIWTFVASISFVIDSSYKDALQSLIFTVVLGLGIACTLFFEKNFRDPVPEFTQVTATRIGSGDFSREETSGRYSTTLAGYLAYRINDGSNLTFFVRVYNGTVIADEILLYKVAKK